MNRNPSVMVIAALLAVTACGRGIGASGDQVVESVPPSTIVNDPVEDSSTDAFETDSSTIPAVATTTAAAGDIEAHSLDVESSGSTDLSNETPASVGTTTSTVSARSADSTATQPPADVDLDAMTEALRELDALLGLFDGQVDSVDLDETEGETP